jgi:hypothetical protein
MIKLMAMPLIPSPITKRGNKDMMPTKTKPLAPLYIPMDDLGVVEGTEGHGGEAFYVKLNSLHWRGN